MSVLTSKRFVVRKSLIGKNQTINVEFQNGKTFKYNHDKVWEIMKDKLTKEEFWDEMDPDKLNLSKDDLLRFCHECVDEWKKNKIANLKYIIPFLKKKILF